MVTFAQEILAEGGDYQPLGSRWIDRFLRRNTDVQTKISSSLESSRTRGSNREAYEDFHCRLHTQIEEKDIKPANITNMDEHGMQELDTEAGKVIGTSLTSRAYVTSSDATAWVSIIEAGTAEGRRLSPVLIFTGASLQGQWFPPGFRLEAEFPDWRYDFSPTGWSNAEIALKWLREVYLVEAKPRSPSEWRLLVLDEHSSHISVKFMLLAHRNKVQLLYLPAHTSHKTQPLDRSVFSALKTYFRQNAKALAGFTASAAINKQRFLFCYRDASARGMAPRNIISGFRATGIWPYNPSQVLDDPEAVLEDGVPPALPPTPQKAAFDTTGSAFTTPQKSQDVRKAQEKAREQASPTNRTVRALFNKVGRSLDRKNAEIAALRAQVAHQSTELEVHRPRTRKRVREGANDRFSKIEDIAAAEEASRVAPKRKKTAATASQNHVVEEAEEMIVHGLDRIRATQEM